MTPMPRIVVTGASGKVGGMIAARLARDGVPQTLFVRDAGRAPDAAGRRGRRGRLPRPRARCAPRCAPAIASSWSACTRTSRPASRRTSRSSMPPPASASACSPTSRSSIPRPPRPSTTAARTHATERMILASGLPYAFLRMNLFLDDLPLWFDPDGVCRGPGGDGRVALISREDTAAVSAGVLARAGLRERGARSHGRGVALAGRARRALQRADSAGRCATSPARARRGSRAASPPASRPGMRTSAWARTRRCCGGEFDVTSDVVRRVTGRPAQSARSWVEANPERFANLGVDARRARAAR